MYTAPEFRLIRKHCPDDLHALLENLSIPMPDFESDSEFKIFEQLDKTITRKMCAEMKSLTLTTGYEKLLKMAGLSDKDTESDDEVISMILDNEDKILAAAEKNKPKLPPSLEKSLITYETEVMIVPIVFGSIFALMTFFYTLLAETYFPMVTIIGTVAGMGCIIFGLRGEKRMKLIKPPEAFIKMSPDKLNKDDVKIALESLRLVDIINKSMHPKDDDTTLEAPVKGTKIDSAA